MLHMPTPMLFQGAGGPPKGQRLFLAADSGLDWQVPAGVTAISVVAIGQGGDAGSQRSGGGGALSWRVTLAVTPGELLRPSVNQAESALYRGSNRLIGAAAGDTSNAQAQPYEGDGGYPGGSGSTAGGSNQRFGGGAGGWTGAGGNAGTTNNGTGGGGSSPYGGTSGGGQAGGSPTNNGQNYGGGGAASRGDYYLGGLGCLRVIWGEGRAFPNTLTGDL